MREGVKYMWNEFEHVEDDRFDPNRDGYYGEYRDYQYGYDSDDYTDYGEDEEEEEDILIFGGF